MKTIEEINEIAPYDPCEWQQGYGIWQDGYMKGQEAGAAEQKAIDDKELESYVAMTEKEVKQVLMDKACKWWNREMRMVNYGTFDEAINAFRKAMEE